MGLYQVRNLRRPDPEWTEAGPTSELAALLDSMDDNTRVTINGNAEWRKRPVDPELRQHLHEAVACPSDDDARFAAVLNVLEQHGLI